MLVLVLVLVLVSYGAGTGVGPDVGDSRMLVLIAANHARSVDRPSASSKNAAVSAHVFVVRVLLQ